jgi:hypothetical protein
MNLRSSQLVDQYHVAPEILEMAEEIAAGADGVGIERWRLEHLVRSVLVADRQRRGSK